MSSDVTSFTLVWIKMKLKTPEAKFLRVTSFTLVWIKITIDSVPRIALSSHELHARVD